MRLIGSLTLLSVSVRDIAGKGGRVWVGNVAVLEEPDARLLGVGGVGCAAARRMAGVMSGILTAAAAAAAVGW